VRPIGEMMPHSFLNKLRHIQLDETAKLAPVSILFHLCASIVASVLVAQHVTPNVLRLWQLGVMLSAAACLLTLYSWRTSAKSPQQVKRFIGYTTASSFATIACWSAPSFIFISQTLQNIDFVIYGITLAVMAMGVVTLMRIPSAAIIFISTLVMVLSLSIYKHLPQDKLLVSALCLTFGLSLNFIVMILHRSFLSNTKSEWKTEEQNGAIAFLLSDFEHETNDWLFETDQTGLLLSFSPSLTEFLEKSHDELIGKNFASYFCEKGDLGQLLISQQDIVNHIVPVHNKGQENFWNITAKPRFDDQQKFNGYNGVGRNITVQHKADLQVREAKDQAEKASAAKSQFLAVISHELRTPINAIVGFSEFLNKEIDRLSPENRRDYLETILESSKQLQGLINDILDATRVERGALKINDQDIDAAELLDAAIKICRDQSIKSNISIVAHLADDITIIGDLTRLKQILVNLITNAIKFSPAESVINIDMRGDAQRNMLISIRDAGIGISAEDAERVFEPFVQLDDSSTRRFGGVGLGLSIARRIARMHGGDVTLKGEIGMGTDATLILPASRVHWPKKQLTHAAA
jgi:signal transduction histidine kinase